MKRPRGAQVTAAKLGAASGRDRVAEGVAAFNAGRPEEAVAHFSAALKASPKNSGVLLFRASAHETLGRLDAAAKDIDAAIALEPRSAPLRLKAARLLFAKGDCEAALARCALALKLEPSNAEARALRERVQNARDGSPAARARREARELADKGRGLPALRAAVRALALEPAEAPSYDLFFELARRFGAALPAAKAAALAEKFLDAKPLHVELASPLVRALVLKLARGGELHRLERLRKLPRARYGFLSCAAGLAHLERGNLVEAATRLREGLECRPVDERARAALEKALQPVRDEAAAPRPEPAPRRAMTGARAEVVRSGRPDRVARLREAGRWSELAAALAGTRDPVLLAQRHQALALLGRFAEAFREGERWLDDPPAGFDMRTFWSPPHGERLESTLPARLAALRRLARGRARAWADYYLAILDPTEEALMRLGPLPERWRFLEAPLGRQHLLRSRFSEALERLRRALGSRPFDWRTRCFMGETLLCLGREDEARAEFDRAVEAAAPGEQAAQAKAWRGESKLWLGRYAEALEDLEDACRAGSLFAYSWRAGAVLKSGDAKKALALLDEARRLFPSDPELPTWRGETLRVLGRSREAERVLSAGTPGLWARINRGLVRAALRDDEGLLEDYWSVPAPIRARALRALGLPGDREPDLQGKADFLAGCLELARGYRREDSYGAALWLPRG